MATLREVLGAEAQGNRRGLVVDSYLRARGAGGSIIALGDAAITNQVRCMLGGLLWQRGMVLQQFAAAIASVSEHAVEVAGWPCNQIHLDVARQLEGHIIAVLLRMLPLLPLDVQARSVEQAEVLFQKGDANADGKLSRKELLATLSQVVRAHACARQLVCCAGLNLC